MQMEIDLAPRSFKTMSTGLSSVSKRARSPEESEDHLHRPLKRRSLAAGNNSSRAFAQHSLQCFYPANGRHLSEDWVQQAGDLSIDSPFDSNPTNEDAMVSEDSDMTDSTQFGHARPHLPPLQTSFESLPGHERPNPNVTHPQRPPPTINVLPPTPDIVAPLRFASLSSARSPISVNSPPISSISSPSRRHRFAMGPRADCQKCRMGVKGHAVHLD
ncbi:hypothetical protein VKT23_004120 [Stygiomarasmius scandens]|uniref:Uncharacterized protein n=1 Tax=Marasmiellus scandens TaxID=2682957 RepID=A0ABR1JXU8_9AGAR